MDKKVVEAKIRRLTRYLEDTTAKLSVKGVKPSELDFWNRELVRTKAKLEGLKMEVK